MDSHRQWQILTALATKTVKECSRPKSRRLLTEQRRLATPISTRSSRSVDLTRNRWLKRLSKIATISRKHRLTTWVTRCKVWPYLIIIQAMEQCKAPKRNWFRDKILWIMLAVASRMREIIQSCLRAPPAITATRTYTSTWAMIHRLMPTSTALTSLALSSSSSQSWSFLGKATPQIHSVYSVTLNKRLGRLRVWTMKCLLVGCSKSYLSTSSCTVRSTRLSSRASHTRQSSTHYWESCTNSYSSRLSKRSRWTKVSRKKRRKKLNSLLQSLTRWPCFTCRRVIWLWARNSRWRSLRQ